MSLKPSSIESIPEATIAVYSPSEWPATPEASIPFSLTHWRAASEVAMMAGWATVVARQFLRRAVEAGGEEVEVEDVGSAVKHPLCRRGRLHQFGAMPGAWEPCPANKNAVFISVKPSFRYPGPDGPRPLLRVHLKMF